MRRLLFFLFFINLFSQLYGQHFTIASYNCENAFDSIHDEGKDDYEYLPQGQRRWSRKRMYAKLKNIGKVILSIDSIRPVDIVCLEEVENDTVMTYLTQRTALASIGYKYLITSSLDDRGCDLAILYSPFTFHLLSHESIRPKINIHTRDVLHATGIIPSGDTLDVFAVHLPSKLKGKKSEAYRTKIASQIMDKIDSITLVRPNAYIVVLGDFNDGPTSKVVVKSFGRLNNLMTKQDHSYKYHGMWDCIDQILVNDNVLSKVRMRGVATRNFMLEKDKTYSGKMPHRTFKGYKYDAEGFSDHLPVFVKIDSNPHQRVQDDSTHHDQ